jgi:hypothetical protein
MFWKKDKKEMVEVGGEKLTKAAYEACVNEFSKPKVGSYDILGDNIYQYSGTHWSNVGKPIFHSKKDKEKLYKSESKKIANEILNGYLGRSKGAMDVAVTVYTYDDELVRQVQKRCKKLGLYVLHVAENCWSVSMSKQLLDWHEMDR